MTRCLRLLREGNQGISDRTTLVAADTNGVSDFTSPANYIVVGEQNWTFDTLLRLLSSSATVRTSEH